MCVLSCFELLSLTVNVEISQKDEVFVGKLDFAVMLQMHGIIKQIQL